MSGVRSRTFRELICRLNKRFILLLPLLLVGSIFVGSTVIPRAHALTGTVCITASATATSCPAGAPALGPITAGQNFTVGVFVQASDAMGGFDIYVQTDNTFANPRAVALGTLIPTAQQSLTSICINGTPQTGSCTVNTANGPGVVEATTIDGSGANECGGIGPCSGMAFTITYTAVAATPSTSFSYPTGAGCSNSSVASPPNTCVLVADAFGTALSENIQAATTQIVGLTLVSVVKGTDNNLYYNTFAGGWGGTWQPLNGQTPSPPSLCASGPTTTELVIRGTDNGIYHKTFSGSTFSATWDRNPNGVTSMQPVCAVLGTTLYVVVVGPTGELWSATFDLSAHTWAAWTDLLGATASAPALAATPSLSRLDLVVRGTNNLIYHKALTSGAWATAWDTSNRLPVPDKTIGAPAIVSDGSQLHVVVIGTEGNLWYATLSFAGAWSTYTSLVGSTPANPVLVIDSANTLHLVVTGSDGHVYEKAHPSGGSWDATWTSAGGIVSGTPAVTTIGTVVHVVVKGGDARLWYNTLSGTTWSGYVFMNGAASLAAGLSTP